MKIQISATTDRGKVRGNNEDAIIVCPDLEQQDWMAGDTPYITLGKLGALLVVADGIGGANAGEKASGLAINQVRTDFTPEAAETALKDGAQQSLMGKVFRNADEAINNAVLSDTEAMGMGTTFVMAWVVGEDVNVAWCGDSRCYVFNAEKGLLPLSKDHSLVQGMVDQGSITEEEALERPDSNIITQALGDCDLPCEPDYTTYHLQPGDMLMLCSDGLSGYASNKEMEETMSKHCCDTEECRDELLKMALDRGGEDNISVIVASLMDDNEQEIAKHSIWNRLLMLFK